MRLAAALVLLSAPVMAHAKCSEITWEASVERLAALVQVVDGGWKVVEADPETALKKSIILLSEQYDADPVEAAHCNLRTPADRREMFAEHRRIQELARCLNPYSDISKTYLAYETALSEYAKNEGVGYKDKHDAMTEALQKHVWALKTLLDPNSNGSACIKHDPELVTDCESRLESAEALLKEIQTIAPKRLGAAQIRGRVKKGNVTSDGEGHAKVIGASGEAGGTPSNPAQPSKPSGDNESKEKPTQKPAQPEPPKAPEMSAAEKEHRQGVTKNATELKDELKESGRTENKYRDDAHNWMQLETHVCEWTFVIQRACKNSSPHDCRENRRFTVDLKNLTALKITRHDDSVDLNVTAKKGTVHCTVSHNSEGQEACSGDNHKFVLVFAKESAGDEAKEILNRAQKHCQAIAGE